ncbi:MAG TPA: 3-oxoacyl-ACP reductase family protein [Steroidobacteraceae bacterium]|jgi:NAD(P)-dependent dehydrogenase (short-subunit alcohol dehydrogenase family)
MNDLTGKIAIVTGAAQGLGAEYAQRLSSAGARVMVADAKPTHETVEAIRAAGHEVHAIQVDVRDSHSVRAMVDATLSAFGGLDILVNNAAIAADLQMKPFLNIDSEDWDRVMAVNARGTFECIKAAAQPMMNQRSGKIINIASTTYFKGAPRMMHYVASKGAVIGITRVASRELGEYGITVNCIAPGLTMTEPLREKGQFAGPAYESNINSRSIKREQIASDLAGALLFLASSQSDFITGQTLVVDGGNFML